MMMDNEEKKHVNKTHPRPKMDNTGSNYRICHQTAKIIFKNIYYTMHKCPAGNTCWHIYSVRTYIHITWLHAYYKYFFRILYSSVVPFVHDTEDVRIHILHTLLIVSNISLARYLASR